MVLRKREINLERKIREARQYFLSHQKQYERFHTGIPIPLLLSLLSRNARERSFYRTDSVQQIIKEMFASEDFQLLNPMFEDNFWFSATHEIKPEDLDGPSEEALCEIDYDQSKSLSIMSTSIDHLGLTAYSSLDTYLRFLEHSDFGLLNDDNYLFVSLLNNTHSAQIGELIAKNIERKYFLKIVTDEKEAIKEVRVLEHMQASRLLSYNVPKIVRINRRDYYKIGDYYFILLEDVSKNNSNLANRKAKVQDKQKQYFDHLDIPFNSDTFKVFFNATFLVDMMDLHIPSEEESVYPSTQIKSIDDIIENIWNSGLSNDEKKLFERIYPRAYQMYSEISHNSQIIDSDIKSDNWVSLENGELKKVDFGGVSYGDPSAVVSVLQNVGYLKRQVLLEYFLDFYKELYLDAGFALKDFKELDKKDFYRKCILRGLLDSGKYLNWVIKKGQNEGRRINYEDNLRFYLYQTRRLIGI